MGLDEMGTMFARREGTDPSLPPVYVGSHLDTQPTGGKYDGVLGVLGGLEVVRSLNDLGIKTRTSDRRHQLDQRGGHALCPGDAGLRRVRRRALSKTGVYANVPTQQGKTFGEELERIGCDRVPSRSATARCTPSLNCISSRGRSSRTEDNDIGVVTHGQGLNWLQVTLTGQGGAYRLHADAQCGAMLGSARRKSPIWCTRSPWAISLTPWARSGTWSYYPNSPQHHRRAKSSSPSTSARPSCEVPDADMEARLRAGADNDLPKIWTWQLEIEQVGAFRSGHLRRRTASSAIREAAERLGYSHRNIISGAGHDACWINRVAPTAMVMCPCVDGLSHNEAEEISKEWASAGADVLFHAVVETAVIVE